MKTLLLQLLLMLLATTPVLAAAPGDCTATACLRTFDLPQAAGRMHYYVSSPPDSPIAPQSALVVMHGHPRDANRSFDAGLQAARGAGREQDTLIVAPLFQVPDDLASHCRTRGVPAALPGDALWTCASWLEGGLSQGAHPIGAFAALDALLLELHRQWPSLRSVTLAGFSAGAQMLQHSIGFAADPPAGITLRYVIADPGSWLYFDPLRPVPVPPCDADCRFTFQAPSDCAGYDDWKYGVQALPAHLGRSAAQARARYAAAQVDYLQGALDNSAAKGAFYPILDKSCAAMAQGPFRLQRGQAYAAYEQALLKPQHARRLIVVPGCGHAVGCVLPSVAARTVLFAPR